MEDNYLDLHICLGCRQTVVGLDAYIQHKRYECLAIKSKDIQKKQAELVQQKDSSSAPFSCEYAIASGLRPDDLKHLASLFGVASCPTDAGRSSAAETLPPLTAGSTSQSTSDLSDSVVLYAAENCSFFNSLQLKSKTNGVHAQMEDKFKSADSLNVTECSVNKSLENMLPFLQKSKDLEQYCSLPSTDLKVETEVFEPTPANDFVVVNERRNGELCVAPKIEGESINYWKSGNSSKQANGDNGYSYDHSKALQIACMFNSLDLDSDSDGLMPSDTEDLLNFSDMDDEHNGYDQPSVVNGDKNVRERGTVAGGKLESYKQCGKLDAFVKSQGKLTRLRKEHKNQGRGGKQIATKWRPGERPAVLPRLRPHTRRGKWRGSDAEDAEEEENQDDPNETDTEGANGDGAEKGKENEIDKKVSSTSASEQESKENRRTVDGKADVKSRRKTREKPACKVCNKTFSSVASMEHHLKTNLHQKQVKKMTESRHDQPSEVKLECALCNKIFNSKYSFARHLTTPFHARRAQYNERHKLIDNTGLEAGIQLLMQRLQPFQCRVCNFYAGDAVALMNHMKTAEHSMRVDSLSGPFVCVRCRYVCQKNDEMLEHVSSSEHESACKASSQPCVLKEKRCKIACTKCDIVVRTTVQLASHQKNCERRQMMRKYRKREPLNCPHCTAQFLTRFSLAVHVRRIHTQEKPFHCRTCDRSFADNRTLKLHRQSKRHSDAVATTLVKQEEGNIELQNDEISRENKQVHKCKQCDFITDKYSDMIVHRTVQHVPPECVVCGLRFVNQLQRSRHLMSRQHRKKEEESKISSGNIFTCDKCPRKFYNSRSLKMHEMNHQMASSRVSRNNAPGVDDIEVCCQKLIQESKLPNGKIECPHCGKFLTKIGILPHLRAHAEVFPFQCTYCSKKFVDASILRRHLKVHLGIRSYRCQFCGREFDRRLTLDTHLMREHKDSAGIVASHLCNICGHKFLQLSQLNAHLKFHDKTVRCPHPGCRLSFRYQSEMLTHMQVHTKETRFLCDECGYAGKTKTQLSRHRRVHTGERRYKCSHCPYVAAHIANLKRHERVHTGNKPYHCPHCKYSCNTQENLRKHILKTKRHAGKPVYPCPKCEFGCNSATEFQSHLEVDHGVSRNHLPSIVAGLYRRDADVKPFEEISDQCLSESKS